MCGICGYISKKHIDRDRLTVMNDSMRHRGPDDSGVEIYEARGGYAVGFAQRRLSIRDLSPLGHQPMNDASGRLSIVYNGEIYNMDELKEELSAYPFHSTCDTEVILAAFLKWGEDFLERLNGMFAFAIYDRASGEVLLARDRIGKKPLYYLVDDDGLIFASTMAPITLSPGFVPVINSAVIPRYLYHQYIHAPESIFKGVQQICPGEVIKVRVGTEGIILDKRKYWDIAERYPALSIEPVSDYEEAKDGLKERLKKAVSDRLVADVPLGLFLSGGYDSSLMTAIACELSDSRIKTFSIGFEEADYDESKTAEAVAEHLGTKHTTRIINEDDMFALVKSLPGYFDEPFADPSEIPTMLVSETAKRDVTVALSGDGGDEFFCGYNVYDDVALAQRLNLAGGFANLLGKLPLGGGRSLADNYPVKVRTLAENRDPLTKTQFGARGYFDAALAFIAGASDGEKKKLVLSESLPIRYPIEDRYKSDNWQTVRMLLDMETYLPSDILCKVDRASMKYSLEARCPILDKDVMEYSFKIPHEFKYRDGEKKAILKDIACDYIPKELLDRPKKGFGAPVDRWLRGPLQKELLEYSSMNYLRRQGIFDPEYVSKFVTDFILRGDAGPGTGKNYSKLVWSFFVFQQWERAWCHR